MIKIWVATIAVFVIALLSIATYQGYVLTNQKQPIDTKNIADIDANINESIIKFAKEMQFRILVDPATLDPK